MHDIVIIAIVAIPLFIMAAFLLKGKGAALIAGYNTMSDKRRAAYDEVSLCRAVGKLLIAIAVAMLMFPVSIRLGAMWLFWLAVAFSLIAPFCFTIYANTGNRYRKPIDDTGISYDMDGDSDTFKKNIASRAGRLAVIIGVVFSAAVLVGIAAMFVYGESDPNIIVRSDRIQISALYGTQIPFSNITNITLDGRSMSEIGAGRRVNGYGGFSALRGHFSSAEHGSTLLFVTPTSAPTIKIERELGSTVFISFRSADRTIATYNALNETFGLVHRTLNNREQRVPFCKSAKFI